MKRILTGIIGFPIVAAILIFANQHILDIIFSIVALISLYEYYKCFEKKAKPVKWIGYLLALSISLLHFIPTELVLNNLYIIIPILISILFLHIIITDMKININDIAISLFGIFYIVFFILFIPLVSSMNNGRILIWYIFFAAWGTDIFALFTGITIGKHKFSKISPNKTIEGCIGGTIGAVILIIVYTLVCNTYFEMSINYIYISFAGVILSVLSQIGDFAASSIKRYVGVKDFGNLFPGHGGMIDRIDSIIFIAPFAYILFTII